MLAFKLGTLQKFCSKQGVMLTGRMSGTHRIAAHAGNARTVLRVAPGSDYSDRRDG